MSNLYRTSYKRSGHSRPRNFVWKSDIESQRKDFGGDVSTIDQFSKRIRHCPVEKILLNNALWEPLSLETIEMEPIQIGFDPKQYYKEWSRLTTKRHSIAERFERLKEAWKNETMLSSDLISKIVNMNYLSIIGMGEEALPFIQEELEIEIGHWFIALEAITGHQPVDEWPEEGKMEAARSYWLNWLRTR